MNTYKDHIKNLHCKQCRFFVYFDEDEDCKIGYCCRYAPKPVSIDDDDGCLCSPDALWPVVDDMKGCGEWECEEVI